MHLIVFRPLGLPTFSHDNSGAQALSNSSSSVAYFTWNFHVYINPHIMGIRRRMKIVLRRGRCAVVLEVPPMDL